MIIHFLLLTVLFFGVLTTITSASIDIKQHYYTYSYGDFSNVEDEIKKDIETDKKNKINFVGDVMLARHVEYLIEKNNVNYPYSYLNFLDKDNSYTVGNFEGSIPKEHKKTPNFNFSFSINPKYISSLQLAGFTHMSLANNHSFDYGIEGYLNSIKILESNNIKSFGNPINFSTSSISILDLPNYKIAIISISDVFKTPSDKDLKSVLTQAGLESDFQIIYIHWGEEYSLVNSRKQKELAQKLVDLGADLIIGHHPHVVQNVEKINNTLVFYSLGNFIFDQYFDNEVMDGLMVSLIDSNGLNLEITPITSRHSKAQPQMMNDQESVDFIDLLSKRSEKELGDLFKKQRIVLINQLATSTETARMAR